MKSARGFAPGWAWPLGIMGVFGVSLSVCAITITLASGNETGGLEEDYYAKAMAWDEISAERRASEALGWSVEALYADGVVRLVITDASGSVVRGGDARALVFHHAARRDASELSLAPTEGLDASFEFELLSDRVGLWEIRLRVERGDDVFVETIELERNGAPG